MPYRIARSLLTVFVLSSGTTASLAGDNADGSRAVYDGDHKVTYAKLHDLAEEGDANAQFNLGMMYDSGQQVPFDEKKAVYWYRRAAVGGNRLAQEYMAIGYQEGWFGLPYDQAKSHYWYQRIDGEIDTAAVTNTSGN